MADDLAGTARTFFDMMKEKGATASPTPSPKPRSAWQGVLDYLGGEEKANAVPATDAVRPKPTPVDPYMNFANKATGKPYK